MPLQQISLDQSIYNKKSPVSQALTPKSRGATSMGAMPQGESMMERSQRLQEVEAERKYQEKMMKLQHEQAMEKAKFSAGMQEDAQRQQTTMGNAMAQAQQQGASRQKIEDNPAPAAGEMWKFYQSLPEENKEQFMNEMSAPTSSGSTVSSGGKSVQVGGQKYNAIFQNWIDTKKVMSGPDGKIIVNEPEREFEKGTFEIVEKGGKVYKFNTATNEEVELGSADDPEGMVNEVVKQAKDDAMEVVKADPSISLEDATHDALLDYNVPEDKAVEIAKFSAMPESSKGTKWYNDWAKGIVDWVKGRKPKEATKKDWEDAAKKTKESSFNEANVTSLTDVISDDVTPAERAHFMNAGATEADIDEAIKRKQGGK